MTLSLRIVGAGFGRTGTGSLKLALEDLGFAPCHHMTNVVRDPRHAARWLAVVRSPRPDLTGVLHGYAATVDWPAVAYWRELTDACPDAKVVLTVRDPDEWYDSVERTLYWQYLRMSDPDGSDAGTRDFVEVTRRVVWDGAFAGRFPDRDLATSEFRRHIDEVVDRVPADRLLVYRVEDGWQPLCDFLGVREPATAFPHIHRSELFRAAVAGTAAPPTGPAAPAGSAGRVADRS